jgi:hypothetical protein
MKPYSTTNSFESTRADTFALMRANPRLLFAFLPGLEARIREALRAAEMLDPTQRAELTAAVGVYNERVVELNRLTQTALTLTAPHEELAVKMSSESQVRAATAHLSGIFKARAYPRHVHFVETKVLPYTVDDGTTRVGDTSVHMGPRGTVVTFADVQRLFPGSERLIVSRTDGTGNALQQTAFPAMISLAGGQPFLLTSDVAAHLEATLTPTARWVITTERARIPTAGGGVYGDVLESASNRAWLAADVDVGDLVGDGRVTQTVGGDVTLTAKVSSGLVSHRYAGWARWRALCDTLREVAPPTSYETAVDCLLRVSTLLAQLAAMGECPAPAGRVLSLLTSLTRAHRACNADIALHALQRCAIDEYAALDEVSASAARQSRAVAQLLRG